MARIQMVEFGKKMIQRGLIAGAAGNLSIKLDEHIILTTPTGVSKDNMSPKDLILVNQKGEVIGPGVPSSELKVHLAIYEKTAAKAVVHGHPRTCTAISLGACLPDFGITAESMALGQIVQIPFMTPGQWPLGHACGLAAQHGDVLVLKHHGAVTTGQTLEEAYNRMDVLEHVSQIYKISQEMYRKEGDSRSLIESRPWIDLETILG